ncbi:ribonuclease HI [Vallitalea sp.]|jgi:ribonuclease HI|uniref:ribonuclease HI n=1 Tax=Vallitalea sp. TaxID=1882829 RepID=UPI0025FED6BB|nr:ribonuclease HI [Vallitalea sp.]MCT4688269.1 ribonuclease HI [Vallitalea sp.]
MLEVNIYTDGACRGNPDGPGGYGVLLEYFDSQGNKHVKELSCGYKKTTNNRMELMGVLRGLEALKKPCKVNLYTDSQYIVKAFNEGWLNNWIKNNWKRGKKKEDVKNVDLWKKILSAKNNHDVTFNWVKGHASHPQNERCDSLATSAADGTNLIEDER